MVSVSDSQLRDWIGEKGGWFHDLEIMGPDNSRGVFATRNINQDEVTFSVPLSAIMYPDAHEEQQLMGYIRQLKTISEHNYLPLTLKLILERQKQESFWMPYIDTLPESPHLRYQNYGKEQTALLKCSAAWPEMKQYRDVTQAELLELSALADGYLKFTSDDFWWAKSMVFSRVFQTDRFGWEDRLCLLPLVDMINHCNRSDVNTLITFDEQTESFIGKATREIESGEEIAYCYGSYSNAETLFLYGFALPDNKVITTFLPVDELNSAPDGTEVSMASGALNSDEVPQPEKGVVLSQALSDLGEAAQSFVRGELQKIDYMVEVEAKRSFVTDLIHLVDLREESLRAGRNEYENFLSAKVEATEYDHELAKIKLVVDDEIFMLDHLKKMFCVWLSLTQFGADEDLRAALLSVSLGGYSPKVMILELSALV